MGEAKIKSTDLVTKIQQHRETYQKRFADLKNQRVLLEEQAKELQEKIHAHLKAEIELRARWSALTEVMEGVDPIPGAKEEPKAIEAPGLPHTEQTTAPRLPHTEQTTAEEAKAQAGAKGPTLAELDNPLRTFNDNTTQAETPKE